MSIQALVPAASLAAAAGTPGKVRKLERITAAFFTDWHDARAAITVTPGGAAVTVRS